VNAKLKMKQMEAQLHMQHGCPHFQGTVAPTVQLPNFMLQTFNPREQASGSGSYCQNLPMEQSMTGHPSFLPSHHQHHIPRAPSSNLVSSGSYRQNLPMEQSIAGHPSFLRSHHHQIPRVPPSSNLVPRAAQKPSPNQFLRPPSSQEDVPPSTKMAPHVVQKPSPNQFVHPPSSQEDPEEHILNDLLRLMRDEGAKGACSKAVRGKSRLVYDPNVENPQIVFTQSREECGDAAEEKEKAKGFNSSSSSNSNRDVPDVKVVKREPDLEEDFTSPSHVQGSSKNDEHQP